MNSTNLFSFDVASTKTANILSNESNQSAAKNQNNFRSFGDVFKNMQFSFNRRSLENIDLKSERVDYRYNSANSRSFNLCSKSEKSRNSLAQTKPFSVTDLDNHIESKGADEAFSKRYDSDYSSKVEKKLTTKNSDVHNQKIEKVIEKICEKTGIDKSKFEKAMQAAGYNIEQLLAHDISNSAIQFLSDFFDLDQAGASALKSIFISITDSYNASAPLAFEGSDQEVGIENSELTCFSKSVEQYAGNDAAKDVNAQTSSENEIVLSRIEIIDQRLLDSISEKINHRVDQMLSSKQTYEGGMEKIIQQAENRSDISNVLLTDTINPKIETVANSKETSPLDEHDTSNTLKVGTTANADGSDFSANTSGENGNGSGLFQGSNLAKAQVVVDENLSLDAQMANNGFKTIMSLAEVRTGKSEAHILKTPDSNQILSQIIDKVKVVIGQEKSEMLMELKPESLGKISLRLVTERGMVVAQFAAENAQVKAILESNMQLLKDSLEKQGLNVSGFSVSVGDNGSGKNDAKTKAQNKWRDNAVGMNFKRGNSISADGIHSDMHTNPSSAKILGAYIGTGANINFTA